MPPVDASTAVPAGLLSLDLGCGGNKKPGTIGLDSEPGEAVDYVIDLVRDRFPFPDDSVGYVYSSNCFEHLSNPSMLLQELPRVCADKARFEFWMPYAFHNHGYVLGHVMFWTEEPFLHICRKHRDFWRSATGVMWNMTDLVFVLDVVGMAEAQQAGFTPGFAVRHLNNVVAEFGVIGYFDKPGEAGDPSPPLEVSISNTREPADRRPLLPAGLPWW